MVPRRLVLAYGCWLAALTVVAFAYPAVRTATFAILGLGSSAAIIYGVRRYRPSRAWSWLAIAAAPVLFAACGVLYVLLPEHVGQLGFYWGILLLRLAVFASVVIGLVGLARNLSEELHTSGIDVVIFLFGAGLLAGIVAALPFVSGPDLPTLDEAVRAVCVVTDVVILVAVVNLVTAVRWSVPVGLLAVGSLTFLIFDAILLVERADVAWPTGTTWDLGWIVFGWAWGTAALLPGMADLRAPDRTSFSPAPIRFVLLVGASLVPLALLLAASVLRPSWYVLVLTGAFAIMLGLVLARLVAVTLELRRQISGERSLREVVTQLAEAADPAAVTALIERMVPALLPGREPGSVEVRSAGEPHPAAIGYPDGVGHGGRTLTLPLDMDASPDQPMMHVHADRNALAAARPRLEAVAAQACSSLDRIRLGQEAIRHANEEYFHTLVQTTADAVLMVDDDDRVSLASPSARMILGQSQLREMWLPGLFNESQRQAVQQLLARARSEEQAPPREAITRQGADPVRWTVPHEDGSTTLVEVSCHKTTEEPSIQGLVVNLHDVTEHQQLKQELAESTHRDSLTDLPTQFAIRKLTRTAVERAATSHALVGKFHIDLDNFALINDQYGYEVGDSVLQTLARRLTQLAPPGCTAARLGGDTFALLVEDAPDAAAVDDVARDVASTLRDPIRIDGGMVSCTASIGVATTAQAGSADDLVRQADFAVRAAKAMGKGHIRRYDPSIHDEMKNRIALQSALESALEQEALSLRYQPIITLDTGHTAGFEALLRWQHPTQGWVSPEVFIDIAETSGLIQPIGEWVLATAMNQLRDWDRIAPGAVPHLSVNVSSHQFRSNGFVRRVGSQLATSGVNPKRLHLEITESLLLPDDERIWEDLQQLRRTGIRIVMDDFGKGYSSLSYLRRVPLDVVKLDRLFVSSMAASIRQYALVQSIVGMAHVLNLEVVAEGIETEAERDLAINAGCALGQGFYYARPLPVDQVLDWLAENAPASQAGSAKA